MSKTISRDTPLAELTLRKYEKPVNLSKREHIRKLCLSIGLLQPGDSRDVVVDVLHVVLEAKKPLESEEIKDMVIKYRKKARQSMNGIASSNVRRQLKRLRNLFLVEKVKNSYRINEKEELHVLFEEKIKKFYLGSIVERVSEYFKALK